MPRFNLVLLTLLAIGLCNATSVAQEQSDAAGANQQTDTPQQPPAEKQPLWYRTEGELTALPTANEQWMNSPPLSLEQLEGKGIVLWFFEEQCPNCEKKWGSMLAAARQHQDKPLLFVAVNSGNTPAQIAGYIKRNRIDWPVIVDTDRSFEKACLGANTEISLNHIYQMGVLSAAGEWRIANHRVLDEVAEAAAEGGSWRVDPSEIPDDLRQAWAQVEIGNYPAASRTIMRAGKGGDAPTKEAAKKIYDAVKSSMDAELASINEQLGSGDNYAAYKALGQFIDVYDGYPMHPAVQKKYKDVGQTEEVKTEKLAAKKVAAAVRVGSKNTPAAVKRAVGQLEKVVAEYPDTEAAAEAQSLLDQVAAGGA